MRAGVHDRYGPPDVLRIEDVQRPVPAEDELLVRVHATTVTQTDCHMRAARPFVWRFMLGLRRPRRRTLGLEFAGVVEDVGSAVTQFAVGGCVFGLCSSAHAELTRTPTRPGWLRTSAARLARLSDALTASRLSTAVAPARAAAQSRLTSGQPGKVDTMNGKALAARVVCDPMSPRLVTDVAPAPAPDAYCYKNVGRQTLQRHNCQAPLSVQSV